MDQLNLKPNSGAAGCRSSLIEDSLLQTLPASCLPEPGCPVSELEESRRQLRSLLNNLPGMVYRSEPSPPWRLQFVSEQVGEMTGYPARLFKDGELSWEDIIVPEDKELVREAVANAITNDGRVEIQYRIVCSSGEVRWVKERGTAVYGGSGDALWLEGFIHDVNEQVVAGEKLKTTQERYRDVLEASADCIKIITLDGDIEFINTPGLKAMDLTGLRDVLGRRWSRLWPEASHQMIDAAVARARAGGSTRYSGSCPTSRGTPKWWDVSVTPMRNHEGTVVRVLAISRDITRQRETAEQLRWASEHDALTGLPNRRVFEARLQAAIIRAMETGQSVGLLMLDLDHFKHVNDTLGHPAGDLLLSKCAERLSSSLRTTDFVARLGGDEFAIVLEGATEVDLMQAGESILERLKAPIAFDGRQISAGASIGGALYPRDGQSANELLKSADIALYALKQSGRGGTGIIHPHMRHEAQVVASQLTLARVSLTSDTIEPFFQPKVDLQSEEVTGLEALLRWHHTTNGLQFPASVSEAFKDYELARKIGELMQDRVLAHVRDWNDRQLPIGFVAINASPAEFLRDDFAETLLAKIERHRVPPALIEVEVTEHAFLESSSNYVIRALELLSRAGVRIALDDFGTGYSSLRHLKDFPVDVLKIDQSFVERMSIDTQVRAIVSAVIGLAGSLSMEVVAEGVETLEQKMALLAEGCALGQGYLFGRPVTASEVPALVGTRELRMSA